MKMDRLTKTYVDGSHGVADVLPCGENSHEYKKLLIESLGAYEDLGITPEQLRQVDEEYRRVCEELGRYRGIEAWFKERYKANISIYEFSDIFIKYFEDRDGKMTNNWKVLTNEHADKWDEYQEAEKQGLLLRLHWHKVADGDLPKGPYSSKRKFYCKERDHGYRILLYDDKGFYYYSCSLDIGIDNEQISAWMELPEYEEEHHAKSC